MAVALVHLKVRPGAEARFEASQRDVWAQTWQNEPGILRYEHYRGQEPGRYYALLAFRDFAGFIAHQVSPHHEAPAWGDLFEEVVLEWLDPVEGSNLLPPSREQDLGPDLDPRARHYAERYRLRRAPWWPTV